MISTLGCWRTAASTALTSAKPTLGPLGLLRVRGAECPPSLTVTDKSTPREVRNCSASELQAWCGWMEGCGCEGVECRSAHAVSLCDCIHAAAGGWGHGGGGCWSSWTCRRPGSRTVKHSTRSCLLMPPPDWSVSLANSSTVSPAAALRALMPLLARALFPPTCGFFSSTTTCAVDDVVV